LEFIIFLMTKIFTNSLISQLENLKFKNNRFKIRVKIFVHV